MSFTTGTVTNTNTSLKFLVDTVEEVKIISTASALSDIWVKSCAFADHYIVDVGPFDDTQSAENFKDFAEEELKSIEK